MRRKFKTVLVFFSVFLLTASSMAKQTRSQKLLRREISYIISRSKSPRTLKGIEIYSRRARKVIYRSYSGILFNPASNLKIVTTSFALHSLGKEYVVTTPFDIAGVQRADTVFGDLVVVGNGDPTLTSSELDSAASAIHAAGIGVITGNVVVDISRFDSLRWGAGWMWDDEPQSYAMFISPATIDHDVVTVNVAVDSSGRNLVVTTDPRSDFVKVVNSALPGINDSLAVTREMIDDTNTIIVGGTYSTYTIPTTYAFSVRYPDRYFGSLLLQYLRAKGVDVKGHLDVTDKYAGHGPRVQVFSLSHGLDSIVTYTNKVSDNLGAECLLREVPVAAAGEIGSAKNGIKLVTEFLGGLGIDSTNYYIVDGSGVSHYDLITPRALVRILRYDLDQSYGNVFFNSLPVSGIDGTLEDRMPQDYVKGKVHAKTGSLSGVSTLSGYVVIPRDTLVFSMMMQNFVTSGDSMEALQDSLCEALSQYSPYVRTFARNLRRHRIGTYGIVRHRRRHAIKPRRVLESMRKIETSSKRRDIAGKPIKR